jgi:hypothetical protein
MNSTRQRIISFILILSFLTSLAIVPTILATEIEENTYERVAGTGLFDLKSLSAPDSIYTTQTQTSPLSIEITYPVEEVYTGECNEAKVGGTISRALKEGKEHIWVALGLPGQWYPQENGPIVPSGLDWETIVYIAGQPMGTKIEVAALIVDDTLNSKLKNYIQDQGEWYEPYENNSEIEENIKASVTVVFRGHKLPNKLLTNFEDYFVDIWFCTKNMSAKKTSEISYSEPYSMNITYTKLPCEEGWQCFDFAFPNSLNLSDYSAISIRVYGVCNITAYLRANDTPTWIGLRSSTEPETWNQLIWDLSTTDVDLSKAEGISFVMADEIGATKTFFLDDIELTKLKIPQTGLLANFEDNFVNILFCTKNMSAKKTSEISYSEPYSMNITYTKLPCEEGWQAFGFDFPSSLNLSDYSAISIRVHGACSIIAYLWANDTSTWIGLRTSTELDIWNQLIWDLTATDVNLSNVTCIALVMDDEIGTTRTFFVDNIELAAKMTPPPKVLSYAPASPVSDLEGSTRTFTLTLNQIANVSWLINGIEIFNETEVTESTYTNTSAAVGTRNVSAVVSNPNGATMQTWDWFVTKPVFGVELSASADALSTAQSENATYLLTIRNTGTVRDNYTLLLENADNADVAASSTYYINNLAAGDSTTVLLNVTDAMAASYRVSVKATSDGDSMKSATINTTTTVLRKGTRPQSIITISVTPKTIKRGESITISGNIIPASSAIITLIFTSPTGSVFEQPTVSPIYSGAYRFVFYPPEEGIWFVNATWPRGTDIIVSETVSFTVNKTINVGYAVIIAGRRDDDLSQKYIDLTANKVYKILTGERGFMHKSIFYLNPRMDHDANDDGVYDVDRISSLENVNYSINTWAKNNVSVDVPLLLYMVDHGGTDAFLVNGANHTLTASDLNNYLDQLTDATGCHNITVVIDACMCGSFIDDLSRIGRIVVTSTGIEENAASNSEMGAVFSNFFFNSISEGKTIKEAFKEASNSPYLHFSEITPMLDDNGDLAASKYIGIPVGILNFPPTIIGDIPSQKVVVNTNNTIWAVVVDDTTIEDVYANIIEPNWRPSPSNDTLVEINLTTLQLEDTNGDGNYTARFTPALLGSYTIILHATDERGYQASPKQLVITVVPPSESAISDTVQAHTQASQADTKERIRMLGGEE